MRYATVWFYVAADADDDSGKDEEKEGYTCFIFASGMMILMMTFIDIAIIITFIIIILLFMKIIAPKIH